MKKTLVVLALVLSLAGAVSTVSAATTVDLYTTKCFGNLKQCYSIGNSAGADISISQSTAYQSVYVTIDGKQYSSPVGGGFSTDITDLTLTSSTGETIILNANYTYVRKQVNSGRLHTWVTQWTLVGGTIVTP